MSQPRTCKIEFDEIYRETFEAYCLVIDGTQYWLPKSQITMFEKMGVVYMPEWLAEKKELI